MAEHEKPATDAKLMPHYEARELLVREVRHVKSRLIASLESGDRNYGDQMRWLTSYQHLLYAADELAESGGDNGSNQ